MSGAMRKMGVYLGLVEDDQYEAEHVDGSRRAQDRVGDYDEHDTHDELPAARASRFERRYDDDADDVVRRPAALEVHDDEVAPTPPPAPERSAHRITTLHPRTYNEARTIGEQFRDGVPVIMNLTEMEDADAKRLVDFAAGLTFGLHGRLERVTAKVFLLSPHNVTVTAQDKAKIENGFFNQS